MVIRSGELVSNWSFYGSVQRGLLVDVLTVFRCPLAGLGALSRVVHAAGGFVWLYLYSNTRSVARRLFGGVGA